MLPLKCVISIFLRITSNLVYKINGLVKSFDGKTFTLSLTVSHNFEFAVPLATHLTPIDP
jgi:hypothetical protein